MAREKETGNGRLWLNENGMSNKYAAFVSGVRCQAVQGKAYVPPRHFVLRQDATIGSGDPANRRSPEARARQGC